MKIMAASIKMRRGRGATTSAKNGIRHISGGCAAASGGEENNRTDESGVSVDEGVKVNGAIKMTELMQSARMKIVMASKVWRKKIIRINGKSGSVLGSGNGAQCLNKRNKRQQPQKRAASSIENISSGSVSGANSKIMAALANA